MPAFRFHLRQLLLAVAAVAVLMLGARLAVRYQGLAVGLLVVGIAAVVLLLANLLLYTFLRGTGALWGLGAGAPAEKESSGESDDRGESSS